MEQNLTARSFIVRIYRVDTEDTHKITGLAEALDGTGRTAPFRDVEELAEVLQGSAAPSRKSRRKKSGAVDNAGLEDCRDKLRKGETFDNGKTKITAYSYPGGRLVKIAKKTLLVAALIVTASLAVTDRAAWGGSEGGVDSEVAYYGYNVDVGGPYTTTIGWKASTDGPYSTAIGACANRDENCNWKIYTGSYTTAVGYHSQTLSNESTALGADSKATEYRSTAVGYGSQATELRSTAVGYSSTASGMSSTALGPFSVASGDNSTATGIYSKATNAGSTAVGYSSEASGTSSTALGQSATATGTNSVALGYQSTDGGESNVVSVGKAGSTRRIINVTAGTADTDAANVKQLNDKAATTLTSANSYADTGDATTLTSAKSYTDSSVAAVSGNVKGSVGVKNTSGYADPAATGNDSVAVGGGAVASAANTVAVGSNARATGTNAIAIGSGAVATGSVAVGTNASAANGGSAVGDDAAATGTASAALGKGATSTGANSVAIGSNSTDGGQSNVVSVGAAGNERRVTNVATGVNATDAVNVKQLNDSAASTLASAKSYTDSRINDFSVEAHRAIAGAVALSRASIPLNVGESGIALGVGTSNGQSAVALSFQHSTKRNLFFNVGASVTSGSTVQAGGGIGFKF